MNPYFSSRNPLTSSQLSSGDRNFDGALVASDESVTLVCAQAIGAHTAKAIEMLKPHKTANGQHLGRRVAVGARMVNDVA
jgi:hypothetical protein